MPTNQTNVATAANQQQQQQQLLMKNDNAISIMDLLHICLVNWKWFVLSLFVCLSLMTFYILRTTPVYTRSAQVLLKSDEKGQNVDASAVLTDMGLQQNGSNIINEMYTLRSPALALEVVKRLNLDVNYQCDGSFHRLTLYGNNLPVQVQFLNISDTNWASFTLRLIGNGKYEIKDVALQGIKIDAKYEGTIGQTIKTRMGRIRVIPGKALSEHFDKDIYVTRSSLDAAAGACQGGINTARAEKEANIINITYNDVSKQRAEDVLNTLIEVYNENWVKEKNQVAVSTSQFINERLLVIERELGNVDEDISSYKSANLLPDVKAQASQAMAQASTAETSVMDLNNQMYMAKFIRSYLSNEANKFQLLPANSGIGSTGVESMISTYNTQILDRNSLVANSSTTNPLVVKADQLLAQQRNVILKSIDNVILNLQTQLKSLQKFEGKATTQIAESPLQAKHLLSVERQQKVKEALYLFLLQKREENELNQAFTAYNTRIISPAAGSPLPTSPVKNRLMLIAFALGLAIPFGIIYLYETTNTRIRGRHDLDGKSTMPFAGEIPYYGRKQAKWKFWKKTKDETTKIVVREGSRNIINEAFRVLRTNLEFMIGNKDTNKENIMILTSYNPGSGKSFISINLAISFAIKRKKVLVIDGDLRHGTVSAYVNKPKVGLSDYLNGNVADINQIFVKHPKFKFLDIVPIGTIPPNPTELLFSPNFQTLIDKAREEYDYVFIDCPPADMVADTAIIEQHADRTIFIIRAGLLERTMLMPLEDEYKANKFKNMTLILNGTESNGGRYRYQYGYKYGYHSYGYYGYTKDDE